LSFTPQISPIAKIKQKTIIDLIAHGKRLDERDIHAYRDLKIDVGVIEKANGSAQVILGKTKVVTGVKIETGEPFPDVPDEGVLTVNAELVPLASPSFEPGPPDENSIELARIVDRGIRESKAIDLKRLCVEAGKKVFIVFVDIYVLDHDGNLIDASAISSLAALLNARLNDYEVKDGQIIYKPSFIPLPIQNYPVAVTIAKIGNSLVVDPSLEEEQVMSSRLTVTFDMHNRICAMQKGGAGQLTVDDVREAVRIAMVKAEEIRRKILETAK
jgi:exosome complex component RRP42